MLTDRECRTAKSEKARKLHDTGGLYLMVNPNGSKLWRMKYRHNGRERTYSIGPYGEPPAGVTLAGARRARDEAKQVLREGRDPTLARRLKRESAVAAQSTTLRAVCEQWLQKNGKRWSRKHSQDVRASLEAEVYPTIGMLPAGEVTGAMILKRVLGPMDDRGAHETARRVRQRLSSVFRHAVATGIVPKGSDPAGPDLLEGLTPKPAVRPQPAIVEVGALREMMRRVEASPCKPTVKLAARFLAVTFVRMAPLQAARWDQFAGIEDPVPVWDIPEENMKGEDGRKLPFLVPLCTHAIDVIEAARRINGAFPYVFPSDIRPETQPISNNAVLYALYRAGYRGRHTGHGFRASFSTIMNERHPELSHVIDFSLGHVPRNKVEAAYNRAKYLATRLALHQEFADMVLEGFPPASALLEGPRR